MNSSTLRRLAADHAALHRAKLPPHWLFHPSIAESSIPDDLTQLVICLTGPEGTPYSQGLWKVSLMIPPDYPKSPPKAFFRTRIWHPNVQEITGSVCVDTLKKDWEPKLNLRDVLMTISCLLIQPNPDSALNSTAGHLLQDDYESFSRQARLMTSIHASIPPDLKEAASAARHRGEISGTVARGNRNEAGTKKGKPAIDSRMRMKRTPQRLSEVSSASALRSASPEVHESDEEDIDAASKENDPALSPVPVPEPSPRRPTLAKRPLCELPCPTEPSEDEEKIPCRSYSEQNVSQNVARAFVNDGRSKGPQLAERSSMVDVNGRSFQIAGPEYRAASAPEATDMGTGRPAKRVCSDEAKENALSGTAVMGQAQYPRLSGIPAKASCPGSRQASAPGALGGPKAGKPRIGLRRL